MIHAIIRFGAPTNSQQRTKLFRTSCYTIGGYPYSLDDIEHGVLRGNTIHPVTKQRWFVDFERDPRTDSALAKFDPRIHFALVSGAKSCPPLRVYKLGAGLERGLRLATAAFVEREVKMDVPHREVTSYHMCVPFQRVLTDIYCCSVQITVSKIFFWYGRDFGAAPPESTLAFIKPNLTLTKQQAMSTVQTGKGACRVLYSEYDWSLNGV